MTNLSTKFDAFKQQMEVQHDELLTRLQSMEDKLGKLSDIDTGIDTSNVVLSSIADDMASIADTVARRPQDDFQDTSMFQVLANLFVVSSTIREAIRPIGQQPPTQQPRGIEWHLSRMADYLAVETGDNTPYRTLPAQNAALYNMLYAILGMAAYQQDADDTNVARSIWLLMREWHVYAGLPIAGENLQVTLGKIVANTGNTELNTNNTVAAIEALTAVTEACCNGNGGEGLCSNAASTEPISNAVFGDIITSSGTQIVTSANIINFSGTNVFSYQNADWSSGGGVTVSAISSGSNQCMADFDPATPMAVRNTSSFNVTLFFFPADGTTTATVLPAGECKQLEYTTEGAFAVAAGTTSGDTSSISIEVLT